MSTSNDKDRILSLALLVQFCDLLLHHAESKVLCDDDLWNLLLWGLENNEKGLERRRALHVLEAILSHWCSIDPTNGSNMPQAGCYKRKSSLPTWTLFVKMYRTVEDTSLHLFTESWSAGIDILHPLQACSDQKDLQPPLLPLPWMMMLWKKALLHRHTGCQKLAALSFLERTWFSQEQGLLTPSFATCVLAPALGQPTMERGMHSEEIRKGIKNFFRSWGLGPVPGSIQVLEEILCFAGNRKHQNHGMLSFLITAAEAVVSGMSDRIGMFENSLRIEERVATQLLQSISTVVTIQPGYGANAMALRVYDSMVKVSLAICTAVEDWYSVLHTLLYSLVGVLESVPLPLLQPPCGRLHAILSEFFQLHFAKSGETIAILKKCVYSAAEQCGSSRQKVILALLTAEVLGMDGLETAFSTNIIQHQDTLIQFLLELIRAATPLPGNEILSSTFNDWVAHRIEYYTAKDEQSTSKLEAWTTEASSWLIEELLQPASRGEETKTLVELIESCLKYSLNNPGSETTETTNAARDAVDKDEALPVDFLEKRNQSCDILECVASACDFTARYMCVAAMNSRQQQARILSAEQNVLARFVSSCAACYLGLAQRIAVALPEKSASSGCKASELEFIWQRIRKEVSIAVLRPLIPCIRVLTRLSKSCTEDGALTTALTSLISALVQGIQEESNEATLSDSRGSRRKKKPGKLSPLTLHAWHHLLSWRCLDAALESNECCASSTKPLALVYMTALKALTQVAADQQQSNMTIPCIRCLRWLLPRMLSGSEEAAPIVCAPFPTLQSTQDLQHGSCIGSIVKMTGHVLLSVLTSSTRKRTGLVAAILATVLHPALFQFDQNDCIEALHASPDGAVHEIVCRLRVLSRTHAKLLLPLSTHLTALLAAYPNVGHHYADILVDLAFAGIHDDDTLLSLQEETLDGPSAGELAALMGPLDKTVVALHGTSSVAPRIGVLCLMHYWVGRKGSLTAAKAVWKMLFHLATVEDEDLVTEKYVYTGFIHRRKLRAWQALVILSPCVDAKEAPQVLLTMLNALDSCNAANVKHLQEIVALQTLSESPEELLTQYLLPRLESSMRHQRAEAVPSLIVLAAVTVLQSLDPVKSKNEIGRLICAIIPWCGSFVHANRTHAQLVLWRLLEVFPMETISTLSDHSSSSSSSISILGALKEFYKVNTDLIRLRKAIGVSNHGLDTFDLKYATSPQGVLCGSQVSLLGSAGTGNEMGNVLESAPVSLLEQVQQYLEIERVALRKDLAGQMQEARAYEDARQIRELMTAQESLYDNDDDGMAIPHDGLSYQRKITPLEKEAKVVDPWGFDSAEGNISIGRTSKRQDIVVVASLIDRIPNLAGLARTCEVFRAGSLVLGDVSVVKNPEFEAISVSAEHWIPMKQVVPEALVSWLRRKRLEGFTLVGLEQTANAVKLPEFRFPRKRVVLVLGAEKEGIPADVLQLLHATVEIPQLGIIRSLNVHVSAALALYEYTCQGTRREEVWIRETEAE